MKVSDWMMVLATLLGPILAVQAQKWVERARERQGRKDFIFQTLMATRAARLSAEHVRALNMIELTFYGTKFLGRHRQSATDRAVIIAWREYLDHFNNLPPNPSNDMMSRWVDSGVEMFVTLLEKMAISLNYEFDRVQLKKGAYAPMAHGQLEQDHDEIRQGIKDLLAGRFPLKVELKADLQEKAPTT